MKKPELAESILWGYCGVILDEFGCFACSKQWDITDCGHCNIFKCLGYSPYAIWSALAWLVPSWTDRWDNVKMGYLT